MFSILCVWSVCSFHTLQICLPKFKMFAWDNSVNMIELLWCSNIEQIFQDYPQKNQPTCITSFINKQLYLFWFCLLPQTFLLQVLWMVCIHMWTVTISWQGHLFKLWYTFQNWYNVDQCWSLLISVDHCWSMLINVDHCWSVLISVDHCWSVLINVDQC